MFTVDVRCLNVHIESLGYKSTQQIKKFRIQIYTANKEEVKAH